MLYSVVLKDYDGNGVIDGDDIGWVSDHSNSRVQNMPTSTASSPSASTRGSSSSSTSGTPTGGRRWRPSCTRTPMASAAVRSGRTSTSKAPMFYDDNWMGNLNYAINNLDGPLPFTPKYEFKLSGSYMIPRVEFDVGVRLPDAQRAAGLAARRLPAAHGVRRSAGSVIIRGVAAGRRRRSQRARHTAEARTSSICTRAGLQAGRGIRGCTSSSMGSTSSTRPPRPTSTSHFEYGKVNSIPQSRRVPLRPALRVLTRSTRASRQRGF